MNYDFKTQKELFERVRPALNTKCIEFKRRNLTDISELDIWNTLIVKKWKDSKGLMLSDVVSDIMNISEKDIYDYQEEKKLIEEVEKNLDII